MTSRGVVVALPTIAWEYRPFPPICPGWQARGEAAVRVQPTPAAVPEKNRLPTFQFEITAKMDVATEKSGIGGTSPL